MALSVARFFRFLRSIFVPLTSVVLFSLLLTWIFVLYQPSPGPGELQNMGWQAWDVVSTPITGSQAKPPSDATGDSGSKTPIQDGVDWWNVTEEEKGPDPTSLPLDKWLPLLPHDTGLTEITIEKCLFPPGLSDLCWPKSTAEADAIKGKWVRVERDLNSVSGLWYLYIYYRRTRRLDVDLINNITLLPEKEQPSIPGNWHKVHLSLRDGVPRTPKLFLWYSLGKTAANLNTEERQNIITELDVLFGDDRPWYGFDRVEPAVTEGKEGRSDSAWLTFRRGVKLPPKAPPLHFSHNGTFKILQVADLHFSVSPGTCRDTATPCSASDMKSLHLVTHMLAHENPDLVVFTGDQLNGQGTSWDPRSVLAKFATAVTDRKIPWAAVFGNHDDEEGLSREEQMVLMQGMPYNLVEPGPKDVHGVGNYVLKVFSPDASKTHLLTLYFLDSGSYSRGVLDWLGFFHPTEYDWMKEDQINWFLQKSASINVIERPFVPDGTSDFGSIWKRQVDQITPGQKKLAKPNGLMFFHIPLPEAYSTADVDSDTNIPLDVGIHDIEPHGNAKNNGGFFEHGVLKAMEGDHDAMSGKNQGEVKVIANGHCHVTENCRRVKGVWHCFGGGGSFSGYGKIGFDRRFRVYEISDFGETIRTWKRTESDEVVDEMVLVGKGAAPPYRGGRRA